MATLWSYVDRFGAVQESVSLASFSMVVLEAFVGLRIATMAGCPLIDADGQEVQPQSMEHSSAPKLQIHV